jgi:outer membrane lipoprotein SlyB
MTNEAKNAWTKGNPLVNIAAVALIIASLSAVAAVFGLIPNARSDRQDLMTSEQGRGAAAGRERASDPAGGRDLPQGAAGRPQLASACTNCGVVEAVRTYQKQGEGTGLGAVAGGVTGAVVGSQFGKGNGRTAMGVLGAVGGAYAGNAIEKNVRSSTGYRVTVRMDDGTSRTVYQSHPPAFGVGEKVRVLNGQLAAREVKPG